MHTPTIGGVIAYVNDLSPAVMNENPLRRAGYDRCLRIAEILREGENVLRWPTDEYDGARAVSEMLRHVATS